jgi:hypothetical protein
LMQVLQACRVSKNFAAGLHFNQFTPISDWNRGACGIVDSFCW